MWGFVGVTLHVALVASCLWGALPMVGSVLHGVRIFLVVSEDHLACEALCFSLALLPFSFSISALVFVHFNLAISESELLMEILLILISSTPFPLPFDFICLYGMNVGLPGIIFSSLISESGIFVQGSFSANCLAMVFLGSFWATPF